MSSAAIRRMPVRLTRVGGDESFDVQELASEAADHVEAYLRGPWLQLNERTRLAKLRRAIELLQRAEGLESGRIPMRMWGD